MSLENVYDYFHNYDKQTYQIFSCMGNEPTEQDIQDFESQYNIHLPADFREFTMSSLGGLYMEVREELWPRPKRFESGPFWSFCRGIIVYGIANEIPEFLDIRVKTKELYENGFTDFIPFLSVVGNGDEIFCFDKNQHVVLLDYTTETAEQLEGNFSDCLLEQIEELEQRKNKKIQK